MNSPKQPFQGRRPAPLGFATTRAPMPPLTGLRAGTEVRVLCVPLRPFIPSSKRPLAGVKSRGRAAEGGAAASAHLCAARSSSARRSPAGTRIWEAMRLPRPPHF
jgi:hypothetical protein